MFRRIHILRTAFWLFLQYTIMEVLWLISNSVVKVLEGNKRWLLGMIGMVILAIWFPFLLWAIVYIVIAFSIVFNIWMIFTMDCEELGIDPKRRGRKKEKRRRSTVSRTKALSDNTYPRITKWEMRKRMKKDLKEMRAREKEDKREALQQYQTEGIQEKELDINFNGLSREHAKEKYETHMVSFRRRKREGDFDQMQEIVRAYHTYCRKKGWA